MGEYEKEEIKRLGKQLEEKFTFLEGCIKSLYEKNYELNKRIKEVEDQLCQNTMVQKDGKKIAMCLYSLRKSGETSK